MRLWTAALLAALAFVIVVLVLNLGEHDNYPAGRSRPVDTEPSLDPLFARLLPERIVHVCPACGECTHRVEVLENERTLAILDRDGWHRLFWAEDDRYFFKDGVHLAASYANPSAGTPEGAWRIRARVGPAIHGPTPPHRCSPAPREAVLDYRLVAAKDPVAAAPLQDAGGLPFFETLPWLAHAYHTPDRPPVVYYAWTLAAPARLGLSPCDCAKP